MARADRLRRRAARAANRGNTSRAENLERRAGNVDTRRENLSDIIEDPTQLIAGREDRLDDRAAIAAGRGSEGRAERLSDRADAAGSRAEGRQKLWDDVTGVTATEAAAEEQREGADAATEILDPYAEAGAGSLDQMSDLMGLNGPEAQAAAYAAIEGSPGFISAVEQGENAMLQNASATGGLRGGNIQGAMAQFRPAMLNQAIGQQMQGLGGLAGMGANATSQQANIAAGRGDINASEILAGYQQQRDTFGDITGFAAQIAKLLAGGF